MADSKACPSTEPHTFHGWGEGPPWHVCPGFPNRDWVTQEHPAEVLVSPECRDGKHRDCDDEGWDVEPDKHALCPCRCHESEADRG